MVSEIRQVSILPPSIDELSATAAAEGFGMLQALILNFKSTTNCFDRRGEALYTVYEQEQLVGIGGINIDPYYDQHEIGRIRHLYIHPAHRRTGVGRSLIERIEHRAAPYFETFQLFTSQIEAARFYESLGYSPITGKWKVSHIKASRRATV